MSELSYPPIRVSQPNRCYALEMLDNLGGQNSEMSAVGLYFYDHLMTQGEISDFFHRTSIMEMRHLEIFGELAKQLGADPRLWSCSGSQQRYWSPSYNRYTTNLSQILKNAADHERHAIEKYEKQARRIQDPYIVELLRRIIGEEQEHLRMFNQFLQN